MQNAISELVRAAQAEASVLEQSEQATRNPGVPELPLISGFNIHAEIHRGAQGIVYRATDSGSGDQVAIKIVTLNRSVTDRDAARFEREVEILQRLDHPGIVPILGHGQLDGGLFLVMPLLDAVPLDVFCDASTMTVTERLKLFAGITDAVEAAHRAGVIHRDLKPANILVDDDGQPSVIDFGLARCLVESPTSASVQLSNSGQFLGSLPWSSPEHTVGKPSAIDVRSDVYSLGVLLYQMLTGTLPYGMDDGAAQLVDSIRHAAPDSPRSIEPEISRDAETIILKCLRKEPERRYQSAGELRQDVQRAVAHQPIDARRDSLSYLVHAALRRHKVIVLATTCCWLLGIGLGVGMTLLYRNAAVAAVEAEKRTEAAVAENAKLQARIDELEKNLKNPASWITTMKSADELRTLPEEEGWKLVESTWSKLDNTRAKQQFLKAVYFSRQPYMHRGLHFGLQDSDPKVRAWAVTYARSYTLQDPAEDLPTYEKWYKENSKKSLSDALADSLRNFSKYLKTGFKSATQTEQINQLRHFRNNSVIRELHTDPIVKAFKETRLVVQFVEITQNQSYERDTRAAAARALRGFPVSVDVARKQLVPLLESPDHELVSSVAHLLVKIPGDDITEALLKRLQHAAKQPGLDIGLWGVATALGERGDISVIPSMIEVIEKDNTYNTVYGVGYFGLGKLTSVSYDESHDGAWWQKWWNENRERLTTPTEPAVPSK